MSSSDGLARAARGHQEAAIMLAAAPAPLFVVRIVERCEPRLSGRDDLRCEVPPQTSLSAQSLVCLLMRRGRPREIGEDTYRVPVAGGRQLITLEALR
jgi:hypothetical protein